MPISSEELQHWRELVEAAARKELGAQSVDTLAIIPLLDELERQEILASGYKTANEEAQELLNELRAENEQLNKEVDWLADHCREFCESYSYCGECPMFGGWFKCDHEDCGQTVVFRGEKRTANWREAARNAVKEKHDAD